MTDDFKRIRRMSLDEAVTLKLLCVAACDYEMAVEARQRERKILGIKDGETQSFVESLGVQDIVLLMNKFALKFELSDGWTFVGPPTGKYIKPK